MSLTLVTGFFDLAKRENNPKRRQATEYLTHAEFLFRLPYYLVFYVDPEFVSLIQEKRNSYGLKDKTRVNSLPLENSPYYRFKALVEKNRILNPIHNAAPHKDTTLYTIVNWTKFFLIKRVIRENPFMSTHFGWIDFGLSHIATTIYCEEDQVFTWLPEKIRILILKSFRPIDIQERRSYFSNLRGFIAAGYITGPRHKMENLADLFDLEVNNALKEGFGPSEEQLLPIICVHHPDLFDFYYGDYDAVLANYRVPRQSMDNILFQLRHCRSTNAHQVTCMICEKFLESYQRGILQISVDQLASLLGEYYFAAYYHDYPNQERATQIAKLYIHLTKIDPAFHKIFKQQEAHIRNNFSFLKEKVFD